MLHWKDLERHSAHPRFRAATLSLQTSDAQRCSGITYLFQKQGRTKSLWLQMIFS